jgi:hypothetical protein
MRRAGILGGLLPLLAFSGRGHSPDCGTFREPRPVVEGTYGKNQA